MQLLLQGYDLAGITETRSGDWHDWSAAMKGYRLLRKDRLGKQGEVVELLFA